MGGRVGSRRARTVLESVLFTLVSMPGSCAREDIQIGLNADRDIAAAGHPGKSRSDLVRMRVWTARQGLLSGQTLAVRIVLGSPSRTPRRRSYAHRRRLFRGNAALAILVPGIDCPDNERPLTRRRSDGRDTIGDEQRPVSINRHSRDRIPCASRRSRGRAEGRRSQLS